MEAAYWRSGQGQRVQQGGASTSRPGGGQERSGRVEKPLLPTMSMTSQNINPKAAAKHQHHHRGNGNPSGGFLQRLSTESMPKLMNQFAGGGGGGLKRKWEAPSVSLDDQWVNSRLLVVEAFVLLAQLKGNHKHLRQAGVDKTLLAVMDLPVASVPKDIRLQARRCLQKLGSIPDYDRPFLVYSKDQLYYLLRSQNLDAEKFASASIGASDFVQLQLKDMKSMLDLNPLEIRKVERIQAALKTFEQIDGCSGGIRTGSITQEELKAYCGSIRLPSPSLAKFVQLMWDIFDCDESDSVSFLEFVFAFDEFQSQLDSLAQSFKAKAGPW